MFESVIPRIFGWVPISLRRALLGRLDHDQFHPCPALGRLARPLPREKFAFENPAIMNGAAAS
jgi:hypothetical protein